MQGREKRECLIVDRKFAWLQMFAEVTKWTIQSIGHEVALRDKQGLQVLQEPKS